MSADAHTAMTRLAADLLGIPVEAIAETVAQPGGTCPRCGWPQAMRDPVEANALSRCTRGEDDTPLYVCSGCGTDEALQQWRGHLSPPSTWAHPPTATVGVDAPATQ